MNIHNWQIGNTKIIIYSNRKKIDLPYYPTETENTKNQKIIIYLNEDKSEKERILKICKSTWELCYPKEIKLFYKTLNMFLSQKIDLDDHVNRYYKRNNQIIAWFPYYTDNFLIHYSYDNNIIKLYGTQINLYRILTDFASVNSTYFPLHASCLQKENNIIGLVGTSGGGKTSLVLKLIQKGFNFVGDDSLYMANNKVIPVSDLIAISKSFPNHPEIKRKIKKYKQEKIYIHLSNIAKIATPEYLKKCHNPTFFYLQKRKEEWKGLDSMKEPFPCIAHHSFWCLHYFETNNQKEFLFDKTKKSFDFWRNELKDIKPVYLNFEQFENSVENFAKKII